MPYQTNPPNIKLKHREFKKQNSTRFRFQRKPPNVKDAYHAFKMNNKRKIKRNNIKNRELYYLLKDNPIIHFTQRVYLIKKYCGFVPRKINF